MAGVFLIQRGLGVGVSLAAPAVVMTVILGWPEWVTTTAMGLIIVIYTVKGGITAITWSEFLHMIIITCGLVAAFLTAVLLLPPGVHFSDALAIAGAAHKLNPVVWKFNLDDRYNVWSGLIGGLFLSLAYFGCDQSQVQRYLTGRSITQSRLSLLFNAVAKIPMQFIILFIGAMVFVFFVFEKPPAIFHVRAWEQVRHSSARPGRRETLLRRLGSAQGSRHGAGAGGFRRGPAAAGRGAGRGRGGGGAGDGRRRHRHELHLPDVRDAVHAGGAGGAADRGDLCGGDEHHQRGDQLAGHRDRDRHLQALRARHGAGTRITSSSRAWRRRSGGCTRWSRRNT